MHRRMNRNGNPTGFLSARDILLFKNPDVLNLHHLGTLQALHRPAATECKINEDSHWLAKCRRRRRAPVFGTIEVITCVVRFNKDAERIELA